MSEEQYHSASHYKYLTQYHIIWCPKFRFSVLQSGADDALKGILINICKQYGYEIKALEVMPDHIHIFVDCPQTVAYTSNTEVGLKNLSERGNSIQTSERKERLLYRAMDRSRRATNPTNYNDDDTIKKGRKTWKYSNHYKKLKAKHSELCRINAVNRQLA